VRLESKRTELAICEPSSSSQLAHQNQAEDLS
jgi:hypothetical protein